MRSARNGRLRITVRDIAGGAVADQAPDVFATVPKGNRPCTEAAFDIPVVDLANQGPHRFVIGRTGN